MCMYDREKEILLEGERTTGLSRWGKTQTHSQYGRDLGAALRLQASWFVRVVVGPLAGYTTVMY
jgi:hypothetical protein